MLSLLVKSAPATRKCDLVGRKREIEELVFVSANKALVKLGFRWVMFDLNGKVLPIPEELLNILA